MTPTILGLDIGGANLKAATNYGLAASVPFALWKRPEKLSDVLLELIARFPKVGELAVTMTGELCDCFETKREGVRRIVEATERTGAGRRIRYWSTAGAFLTADHAIADYLQVAAANWHALASFIGLEYASKHGGLLIDVGSTTSDLIPLCHGIPSTLGSTDSERMMFRELVYTGVKRTPVCAVFSDRIAAELFATMQDVYLLLGEICEDDDDCDTADERPRTRHHARNRLARMLGHDVESCTFDELSRFASLVAQRQFDLVLMSARAAYLNNQSPPELRTIVVSGSGEFLARRVALALTDAKPNVIALSDRMGYDLSVAAPAYAVARLAAVRP
jgi:(4-(4-[2-(gamma-L-glutamylamino)ethyl]phenoxymethyl)furan-2-yl)methanamine synthase